MENPSIKLKLIAFVFGLIASTTLQADMNRIHDIELSHQDSCVVARFKCRSDVMDREIRAFVVLPPDYRRDGEESFPFLYALHGMGAPYDTYANMSRLRVALAEMPMIVVGFDADRASWYLDSTVKADSQFTAFLIDELMPSVEANWRFSGKRAITGFSMGGFGAMHFALLAPEKFISVSGFSSAVKPTYPSLMDRMDGFKGLLGGEGQEPDLSQLRIFERLQATILSGVNFPPIYQHCGTEDFLIDYNREFRDLMVSINQVVSKRIVEELGGDIEEDRDLRNKYQVLMQQRAIQFRYVESPGAHDWSFWHGNIVELLRFHYTQFSKE